MTLYKLREIVYVGRDVICTWRTLRYELSTKITYEIVGDVNIRPEQYIGMRLDNVNILASAGN